MIKVYTRTVCPKCIVAKNQLSDLGVEFETINLEEKENEVHAEKLREAGFQAAPIFEQDGNFFTSINELNLD